MKIVDREGNISGYIGYGVLLIYIIIILIQHIQLEEMGGVFLPSQADPITVSGTIASQVNNTRLGSNGGLARSPGDHDLFPILVGIVIGITLIIAGIVYRIGYNRFGGDRVIVEGDDRLGEG